MTPNHEDLSKQETLATSTDHTAQAWRVRIRYFRRPPGLTSSSPPLVCLTVYVVAFPTPTIILVTTPARKDSTSRTVDNPRPDFTMLANEKRMHRTRLSIIPSSMIPLSKLRSVQL